MCVWYDLEVDKFEYLLRFALPRSRIHTMVTFTETDTN